MRNLQQNKQWLWVNLQKFWQKTNLKMLTLSGYKERENNKVANYLANCKTSI